MSITKTTKLSTGSAQTPAAVEAFSGRFAWVDPHDLVVDPYNHRKNRRSEDEEDTTRPDADLQASVDELGVLTPLVLRPQSGDAEGKLGIIFGQRRNNAALASARKAKGKKQPYKLVPAIIRDDLAGVDDAALTVSFIENKHRRQATVRDDIEAAEQLALMDISKTRRNRHARAMGFKPAEIAAAPKAAKLTDEVLAEALEADFNLVELAEFQEVEDIDDALWTLQQAKRRDQREGNTKGGHWKHALTELRETKDLQAAQQQIIDQLTADEIPIVDWQLNWSGRTTRPLTDLLTGKREPMTADLHETCPGHAACIDRDKAAAIWVCTAWHRHGHHLTREAAQSETPSTSREEEQAARREVIANNKSWRQARTVRHEFITDLCSQPEASMRVWPLILSMVTGTSHWYEQYVSRHRTDLVAQFLGVPDPNEGRGKWSRVPAPFAEVIARTSPARAWRVLLAHVAAAYELEHMDDAAWRNLISAQTVAWLTFLKEEGYALKDFEAEVLKKGLAQMAEQDEAGTDTSEPAAA
ncbi:ParB N-terminal domain-containing protein [Streptomyces sp. NBC_01381]|uniref:ParB/RepB/Spo0J family partition protein n=1 Tax=Streptomyces sp. NBC_01381 TaxID=2903845 RepID=UPI00224EB461|nr:ParB N-terminal domain-containing protein [Streptomyces sp. NBC_01381]MCX4666409.1 ParB N-terminal domain-containing protein [Streptomyces sp. NBC_01381]